MTNDCIGCVYYQGFKPCSRKNTLRCPIENRKINKDDHEKAEDILDFFKQAFCVDGPVEFVERKAVIEQCIKLTDSRRGIFYIARVL